MEVPEIGKNREPEQVLIESEAAFLVYVNANGTVGLSPDINVPLVTKRAPTGEEIWHAVSAIKKDLEVQRTAVMTTQLVLANLQGQAMRAFDAQQNAEIMGKLGNLKQ